MFAKVAKDLLKAPKSVKIQELVIVAHGNRWGGLEVPVTEGDYGTGLGPKVIATLQREIYKAKNRNFKFQRETVIEHFDEKSWVAVRACNFGYSDIGMFALYSLFGGRANVYGIRAYMTFITYGVYEGKKDAKIRFTDIYEFYDLLRKQGFLPREPGLSPSKQIKTLKKFAKIKQKQVSFASQQAFMPLFEDNENFEGIVSQLVTLPASENSPSKPSLQEVVQQLNSNNSTGITTLIRREVDGFDLVGNIRIAKTSKENKWKVSWRNSEYKKQDFRIELKSPGGEIKRVLSIYSNVTRDEKYSPKWAGFLTNYDQAGCELHAQLDLYSIEDLTCLLTYIRANYGAKDAVLIEQTQRSIERRIDYPKFFVNTECYEMSLRDPLEPIGIESCTWFSQFIRGVA